MQMTINEPFKIPNTPYIGAYDNGVFMWWVDKDSNYKALQKRGLLAKFNKLLAIPKNLDIHISAKDIVHSYVYEYMHENYFFLLCGKCVMEADKAIEYLFTPAKDLNADGIRLKAFTENYWSVWEIIGERNAINVAMQLPPNNVNGEVFDMPFL